MGSSNIYIFSYFAYSFIVQKSILNSTSPKDRKRNYKTRVSFYSLIDRNRNIRQSLFNRLKCKIYFLQAFLEHLFTILLFVNSQNQTIDSHCSIESNVKFNFCKPFLEHVRYFYNFTT